MRGLMVAGTHSGCGKTTLTLGILAALKSRGLEVQSFKCGPDFIDAGLHRMITGRPSRNLDLWMCGSAYVHGCYEKYSDSADVSVVEGVMGLYDGSLSTAALAADLRLPIVLVIDGYGMAETAGAIVQGVRAWGEMTLGGIAIAGVVFNRVASETHFQRLRKSVQGVPVLGYLPREGMFEIPHRHLGLQTAEEMPLSADAIARLADAVETHIDLDCLIRQTDDDRDPGEKAPGHRKPGTGSSSGLPSVRIAIAYDRAFSFYYEDNLDLLRAAGAEIVRFSPLSDAELPLGISAVYMGGGYPEVYAEKLSANRSMLRSIRAWAESGKPLYAECGGLMYLSKGIADFEGTFFPMAEVFPFETVMKKGRSRLGYRKVILKEDCLLGKKGEELKGHEFHYSEIGGRSGGASPEHTIYSRYDGTGGGLPDEGYRCRNTVASYIHLHFGSNAAIVDGIINTCRKGGS